MNHVAPKPAAAVHGTAHLSVRGSVEVKHTINGVCGFDCTPMLVTRGTASVVKRYVFEMSHPAMATSTLRGLTPSIWAIKIKKGMHHPFDSTLVWSLKAAY